MKHNDNLNNELSQTRAKALELLLQGLSDAQVAAQVGIDRSTIFRWRKSPEFAADLAYGRQKLMEQSTARLQSLLDPALDILQKQLQGEDPKTALRAAAILVRIAAPSRATHPPRPKEKSSRDAYAKALDDYINAPMPDGSNPGVEEEADEDEHDDET